MAHRVTLPIKRSRAIHRVQGGWAWACRCGDISDKVFSYRKNVVEDFAHHISQGHP